MSETKFTPGPWLHYADVPSTDPHWHIVTNESRMRVIANIHIEPGNAVDEANARLIASAPDLYNALRRLFNSPVGGYGQLLPGAAILDEAERALAKAQGPSP